ncbi:MAG: CoB--CoM heterodisulfide reductase iron-sulfur subunit B family protein [Candidatus Heimdallarchaeota archaeon]|nr:CoB--CoM heterodisulfide reductase iron-sulfur subunit B family protein [Candidatus Heimdallarchaeota archaeon]MBY8996042.1 CoB--CoM heterodisulfide reductase iron-sulfur subunit B family protein [Candidatus Heimdallarchaeota archaeon]
MDKAYLYLGCKVPTSQYAFELSVRAIVKELKLPIEVQEEFNCCGFPFIAVDKTTWLYLAARNMAVAEKEKRNLIPICNGCYLSFNEAREELLENSELRKKINKQLAKEGLSFKGKLEIVHLVDIFYEAREDIKAKVTKNLSKKKIAVHLGCHGEEERGEEQIGGISRLEKMMAVMKDIGLETEVYPTLHECCGAGGIISEHDMPFRMTGNKLTELIEMGFEGMATICPFCQSQYETKQAVVSQIIKKQVKLPVYYLTQLMGMAFGMDEEALGLHLNATHTQ